MVQKVSSDFTLGIMAGGQLGKMLALAAHNWDVRLMVMDPNASCSAAHVCHDLVIGNYLSYDDVLNFGKKVDMLVLEIEHVNVKALKELKEQGKKIYPAPELLEIIQDKGLQKKHLQDLGFPTSPFRLYDSAEQLADAIKNGKETFPFVQKTRTMGYDGMGVKVLKSEADVEHLLNAPSMVEDFVPFEKELAVIVARNPSGDIKTFPTVEMVFHEEANLVDQLECPANIVEEIESKAQNLAYEVAKQLNLEGILAIEMFLTKEGDILINEMAPRPHNSGHHTIEGCATSQYEQLLRAIFNFPLGSTELLAPSIMVNILGEEGYQGLPKYNGLDNIFSLEGVSVHLYGKKETRPNRKMGHVTIVHKSKQKAQEAAQTVKNALKVTT